MTVYRIAKKYKYGLEFWGVMCDGKQIASFWSEQYATQVAIRLQLKAIRG